MRDEIIKCGNFVFKMIQLPTIGERRVVPNTKKYTVASCMGIAFAHNSFFLSSSPSSSLWIIFAFCDRLQSTEWQGKRFAYTHTLPFRCPFFSFGFVSFFSFFNKRAKCNNHTNCFEAVSWNGQSQYNKRLYVLSSIIVMFFRMKNKAWKMRLKVKSVPANTGNIE